MKRILAAALLLIAGMAQAQKYSPYYYQRVSLFETLGVDSRTVVFLGNSITDGSEWCELMGNAHVVNRGISGDTSEGVFDRLESVIAGKPAKIFLMIGTNDLAQDIPSERVADNIRRIVERVQSESPATMFYIESVLPVSDRFGRFAGHTSKGEAILDVNERLKSIAREKGVVYVDLHTPFTEAATGKLDSRYTNDGLHLTGDGYLLWRDIVKPMVAESRASYRRRLQNR